MTKYISYEGTTCSSRYFEQVDMKRRAAVQRAAEGEHSLAFMLFRQAFEMAPRMPQSWQQHEIALQEVRRAVDYHLNETVTHGMQSLHAQCHQLFSAAGATDEQKAALDLLLEEHTRDVEEFVNDGARVAQMQMSVEMMCRTTEITPPRLRQLELLFTQPHPQ